MRDELPSADQVVEELADRVASRIDYGAPVAFGSALDELVDYHRFLLGLSAQAAPGEPPFSYAEIEGRGWGSPPHRHWIRQYRRLFERAVEKITQDAQFVETLAYVPYRLIQPVDDDLPFSTEVVRGILDLGPMLMHSYEAWFTRRSQSQPSDTYSGGDRVLAGSDSRSFANAVRNTIGAWEALLQIVPYGLGWRDTQGRSEAELWKAYADGWPLLWFHLSDTAYCLALAVWNEDPISSGLFSEALIRWPGDALIDLAESYGFRLPHLLFPDLFRLPWTDARDHALRLAFGSYECTPSAILAEVLAKTKNDVLLITASLLLHWSITKKRAGDIGPQIARQLLRQEMTDDASRPTRHEWSLSSAVLQMMRLRIAGERFEDGSYGANLDQFLRVLDTMSERDIVPGRVFTPSTLNDREGLSVSNASILAAAASPNQQAAIHPELREWIDSPALLPRDDQSLRAIHAELDQFLNAIGQGRAQVAAGLELLDPETDTSERVDSLKRGVEHIGEAIDRARQDRLRKQPIDENKIESRRQVFEQALLTPPADVPFFEDVPVERIGLDKRVKLRTLRFLNIAKERLVEPTMGPNVVNEVEVQTAEVRSFSGSQVFADLTRRRRRRRRCSAPIEVRRFWDEIEPLIAQVEDRPILLVSAAARMRLFERIFKVDPIEGVHVEKREHTATRNQYVTTVQGVDVFGGVTDPGSAWLLSRSVIQAVQFSPVTAKDRFVELSFVLEPDQLEGVLETRIRQRIRWGDGVIFQIECPDPPPNE